MILRIAGNGKGGGMVANRKVYSKIHVDCGLTKFVARVSSHDFSMETGELVKCIYTSIFYYQRMLSAYPAKTTILITDTATWIIIRIFALLDKGRVSAGPKVKDVVNAR